MKNQLEQLTQKIGHAMFDRMLGSQPGMLNPQFWEERMMRLFMADEWLKVQSFRFIDVLPTMRSRTEVARHLREYFVLQNPEGAAAANTRQGKSHNGGKKSDLDELTPDFSKRAIALLTKILDFDRLDSSKAQWISWAAQTASVKMAHRFIAGTNIVEAERTIRRMRDERLAFTVDVLGEAALSEAEAEHYQAIYLSLITDLAQAAKSWPTVPLIDTADGMPVTRVNVSVKLTSLFSQTDAIDPEGSKRPLKERLRPLLRAAKERGVHLHVDMEHSAIKDLTLDLFREVMMETEFRDYPHFGIVLQAYLKDGPRDAYDMVEFARKRGTPLWVRLVKGAYWDSETVWAEQNHWPCPVWTQKWQSDACYEEMTRILLQNHEHVYCAFGSHNIRSLAHAMALKQVLGIPGTHFELQMLYGMGDPIKHAAADLGQRVRVYTPYGQLLPGMAYLIRRLLENTANESFLRHSVDENTPREKLLENPLVNGVQGWGSVGHPPPVVHSTQGAFLGATVGSPPSNDYQTEESARRRSNSASRKGDTVSLPPNRLLELAAVSPRQANSGTLDSTGLHSKIQDPKSKIAAAALDDADLNFAAIMHSQSARAAENPPRVKFEFGEPIMDPFENVPNTDFTREPNRQKMISAIADWRRRLNREYPLVIGGQRMTTGQWKESLNPSRPAEVIGRIAQADAAATEKAVAAAHSAFKSWRRVSPEERADYLFKVAEIMERRRFDLSALMSLECGKPWREADADLSEAIDFCNYYAKEMIRISENVRRRDIPGETNEYFYAPRGVVAVISPWNFPLAILTGMAVAAIVTGNAVIMKPAEPACVIAYTLMEMFEEAHLPAGVLNYCPGSGSIVGEALTKHPQVAMIAFTGSREVGCRINRVAAETVTSQPALKKVIAEMGGKNATIIDSDADLDEAIKGVIFSAFGYAGQKCSASSRAIVLEPVYDHFVSRLVEAARSITVGPADDCGTFVPPVIDKRAYDNIRKYIEIGKGESRCLVDGDTNPVVLKLRVETAGPEARGTGLQPVSGTGFQERGTGFQPVTSTAGFEPASGTGFQPVSGTAGFQPASGGYYIGPTIFADVARTARVACEEIFGPVLSIIKARDIDDAIDIFNNTDFALTGGIFSRSPANIEKARAECECGNFYINRKITGALVDAQPFGGFKMSGIGSKAGGPDYLIQFCEPRTVTENTLRRGFAPSEEVVEAVG